MFKCKWPETNRTNIMILADTHLLGIYRGHWLDQLKRYFYFSKFCDFKNLFSEWQMYRSFQTAVRHFKPDAVFFLGFI